MNNNNELVTDLNPDAVVDLFCEAYAERFGEKARPLSDQDHYRLMQMLMKAVAGYGFLRGWKLEGIKNAFDLLWQEAHDMFVVTETH